MWKVLLLACALAPCWCLNGLAQKNELNLLLGGGRLCDDDSVVNASALTLAYTRSLIAGLAVEGSLDLFFVKNDQIRRDDYGAAQIGVLYDFGFAGRGRSLVPYVIAGVGKVTTDFTEIPAEPVYKL